MYVVNIAEIKAIDAMNIDNLSPGLSFIFFFTILSFFFINANGCVWYVSRRECTIHLVLASFYSSISIDF